MQRLLEVAARQRVHGPAAVARKIGESDQTLTNWSARGISQAGAIKAQSAFGCSAQWILHGTGPAQLAEVSEVAREISEMSHDALHLALLFDDATREFSRLDTVAVYHAASAAIMEQARKIRNAPGPDTDGESPSDEPGRSRPAKISRA